MLQIPFLVAVGCGKSLTLWNVSSLDKPVHEVIAFPDSIVSCAFNHNNQVIAACNNSSANGVVGENCVSLHSVKNGDLLNAFGSDKLFGCRSVRFAGKSRLLCCLCEGKFISVWDLKRMIEIRRFDENPYAIVSAGVDSSDLFVFSLSVKRFTVYSLKDNLKVHEIQFSNSTINYCCFDSTSIPDKTVIAIGNSIGKVALYEMKKDYLRLESIGEIDDHSFESSGSTLHQKENIDDASVMQISFSSEYLAVLRSYFLVIYNWLNQSLVTEIKLKDVTRDDSRATCFCWNGSVVAIGCTSGQVFLFDWITRTIVSVYQGNEAKNIHPIACLTFSSNCIEISNHESQCDALDSKSSDSSEQTRKIIGNKNTSHTSHSTNNAVSKSCIGQHQTVSSNVAINSTIQNEINNAIHEFGQDEGDYQLKDHRPDNQIENIVFHSKNTTCSTTSKIRDQEASEVQCKESTGTSTPPNFSSLSFSKDTEDNFQVCPERSSMETRILQVVREEIRVVSNLLHAELLRQFQMQSANVNHVLSKHLDILDRLVDENAILREENIRLKENLQNFQLNA